MKLSDLKSGSGKIPAWPPRWVESSNRGQTSPTAEEGVLERVDRLGNRLLLQVNADGHRRTASLEWDPPPSFRAVEAVLLAGIGAQVRDLANWELAT